MPRKKRRYHNPSTNGGLHDLSTANPSLPQRMPRSSMYSNLNRFVHRESPEVEILETRIVNHPVALQHDQRSIHCSKRIISIPVDSCNKSVTFLAEEVVDNEIEKLPCLPGTVTYNTDVLQTRQSSDSCGVEEHDEIVLLELPSSESEGHSDSDSSQEVSFKYLENNNRDHRGYSCSSNASTPVHQGNDCESYQLFTEATVEYITPENPTMDVEVVQLSGDESDIKESSGNEEELDMAVMVHDSSMVFQSDGQCLGDGCDHNFDSNLTLQNNVEENSQLYNILRDIPEDVDKITAINPEGLKTEETYFPVGSSYATASVNIACWEDPSISKGNPIVVDGHPTGEHYSQSTKPAGVSFNAVNYIRDVGADCVMESQAIAISVPPLELDNELDRNGRDYYEANFDELGQAGETCVGESKLEKDADILSDFIEKNFSSSVTEEKEDIELNLLVGPDDLQSLVEAENTQNDLFSEEINPLDSVANDDFDGKSACVVDIINSENDSQVNAADVTKHVLESSDAKQNKLDDSVNDYSHISVSSDTENSSGTERLPHKNSPYPIDADAEESEPESVRKNVRHSLNKCAKIPRRELRSSSGDSTMSWSSGEDPSDVRISPKAADKKYFPSKSLRTKTRRKLSTDSESASTNDEEQKNIMEEIVVHDSKPEDKNTNTRVIASREAKSTAKSLIMLKKDCGDYDSFSFESEAEYIIPSKNGNSCASSNNAKDANVLDEVNSVDKTASSTNFKKVKYDTAWSNNDASKKYAKNTNIKLDGVSSKPSGLPGPLNKKWIYNNEHRSILYGDGKFIAERRDMVLIGSIHLWRILTAKMMLQKFIPVQIDGRDCHCGVDTFKRFDKMDDEFYIKYQPVLVDMLVDTSEYQIGIYYNLCKSLPLLGYFSLTANLFDNFKKFLWHMALRAMTDASNIRPLNNLQTDDPLSPQSAVSVIESYVQSVLAGIMFSKRWPESTMMCVLEYPNLSLTKAGVKKNAVCEACAKIGRSGVAAYKIFFYGNCYDPDTLLLTNKVGPPMPDFQFCYACPLTLKAVHRLIHYKYWVYVAIRMKLQQLYSQLKPGCACQTEQVFEFIVGDFHWTKTMFFEFQTICGEGIQAKEKADKQEKVIGRKVGNNCSPVKLGRPKKIVGLTDASPAKTTEIPNSVPMKSSLNDLPVTNYLQNNSQNLSIYAND